MARIDAAGAKPVEPRQPYRVFTEDRKDFGIYRIHRKRRFTMVAV